MAKETATPTATNNNNNNEGSSKNSGGVPIEEQVAQLAIPPLPEQLDEIPVGTEGAEEFESWCHKAIRICFATGLRNVQLESMMWYGEPSGTKKSDGYPQPAEHNYQYVDKDVQHPDHVVLPFPRGGYSTRNLDKISVKRTKMVREVY